MWEGVIGKEIPKREKREREEKRKSGRGEKKRILIWEAEEGRERQKNLCGRVGVVSVHCTLTDVH